MRQQSIPSVTQNQAMAVSCCPSTKTCSFLRRSKVCSPSRSPHTQRSPHTHKIAGERGIFHQDSIFSTSSCSVDRYQLCKYPLLSHLKYSKFWRSIDQNARMYFMCEDGIFITTYHGHFGWNIWLFHDQETCKSTTPKNTP
jgi:hypothetical protein